jgi:hypothetical protein
MSLDAVGSIDDNKLSPNIRVLEVYCCNCISDSSHSGKLGGYILEGQRRKLIQSSFEIVLEVSSRIRRVRVVDRNAYHSQVGLDNRKVTI